MLSCLYFPDINCAMLIMLRWDFSWKFGDIMHWRDDRSDQKSCTYCLVGSREASMLLELRSGVTCLEYEGQPVSWRKDWLFVWVISWIFLPTKTPQDLLVMENLNYIKTNIYPLNSVTLRPITFQLKWIVAVLVRVTLMLIANQHFSTNVTETQVVNSRKDSSVTQWCALYSIFCPVNIS